MAVNQDKLDTLVGRLITEISAGYGGVMVALGDKLGLYKAMAGAGPLSSQEVARRSGCAIVLETRDPAPLAEPVANAIERPPVLPGPDAAAQAERLLVPVRGINPEDLRDNFLDARGKRVHRALDIMAKRGTPVVAAGDGRVAKVYRHILGGLCVYQYDARQEHVYYYAHLEAYAPGLAEGVEHTAEQGVVNDRGQSRKALLRKRRGGCRQGQGESFAAEVPPQLHLSPICRARSVRQRTSRHVTLIRLPITGIAAASCSLQPEAVQHLDLATVV